MATVRAAEREGEHEWISRACQVLASADPTRIDQVLANLLGNAAKFTPAGGRIRVRLYEHAGEAVLLVEDSGPGVKPDLLPHIFELFAKDAAFARPQAASASALRWCGGWWSCTAALSAAEN